MKKGCILLLFWLLQACAPTTVDLPVIPTDPPLRLPSSTQTKIPQPNPTATRPVLLRPSTTHDIPQAASPHPRSGQLVQITSIQMFDRQTGWALDAQNRLLHTVDGGFTWQDVTPPEGAYNSNGFFALDSNRAWVTFFTGLGQPISAAVVWYTQDGGINWQTSQPFPVNLDREGKDVPVDYYQPQNLYFLDSQTGWLLVDVYYGMHSTRLLLFCSQDGGQTWKVINDHYHDLQKAIGIGVIFIDQKTGWYAENDIRFQWMSLRIDDLVAQGGWKLRKTNDGGDSFREFSLLPLPPEMKNPAFRQKNADCGETRLLSIVPGTIGVEWTCWIYTEPRQELSFFAISEDAGSSWHLSPASGNEFFLDAQNGWRLVNRQVQQTFNSGQGWINVKTVAWETAQFDFVDLSTGWAIVTNGNATALVQTTDGGKTWQEITPLVGQ